MSASAVSRRPAHGWVQVAVIPAELLGGVLASIAVLVQFVLLTALLLVVLLAPLAVVGALIVHGLA